MKSANSGTALVEGLANFCLTRPVGRVTIIAALMSIFDLQAIPALSDNYIWLMADHSGRCVLVDPGEAAPALQALRDQSLDLAAILLTHHHFDHIDGVPQLRAAFPNARVVAGSDPRFGDVDVRVGDGDRVEVPRTEFAAVDRAHLEALVQVAFSQRRKLLRHTLGRWLEARQFPGQFDTQRRAEEVPVSEFVALAQACS